MRLVPALLLIELWTGAALADTLAQNEALAWLQRIANAARQLNYTGIFVYQHGDQSETSRITHYVDRTGEHEKLETLDGPPREIIRNNAEIITYYAETGEVKRERRSRRRTFPALLPEQLAALTEFYDVRKGSQERIAGYDALALVLQPKDGFRYGHKLWAEVNTGLLLKAKMVNDRHQQLELFHFTQLAIGAPLTRDSVKPGFPIPGETQPPTSEQDTVKPAESGWVVRSQPAGFRKIMEMRRLRQGRQGWVVHLVYSDGLAAVSVFIEPLPPAHRPTGTSAQGAVNIYTRTLSDHLVTVLGEAPPATLMQMANSVSQTGK
jgi:sigma-E factor negative regulatory protein RseB